MRHGNASLLSVAPVTCALIAANILMFMLEVQRAGDMIRTISTELSEAKLKALGAATEEAHRRAEILVKGLGGKLGAMRSSTLGVYQITPRDSTNVSDYGINDTSTREKDVTAVVTATFAVNR